MTAAGSSDKRALAVTVGDSAGHLIPKIRKHLPEVMTRFARFSAVAMTSTPFETIELLDGHGTVRVEEPDGRVGLHRRRAVEGGFAEGIGHVWYFDLDHVLRWVEHAPDEFDAVLDRAAGLDCLVVGRSEASMAALPRRLHDTEVIVNRIFALATGRQWDVMMAARALSPKAVETICGDDEESIANDVTWPIRCLAAGLRCDHVPADGLTYAINEAYANGTPDPLDDDPRAWSKRIRMAAGHAAAIDRLLPLLEG